MNRQSLSQKRRTPADEPFFVIRSLASTFAPGHALAKHRHTWHQLVFAATGVMTVWTERGSWVTPPGRAIWVPAGVEHSIDFYAGAQQSAFRTLYVRPAWAKAWAKARPGECAAVQVSPLLREPVLRIVEHGMLDRREPTDRERRSDTPPFELPVPTTQLLQRAAQHDGALEKTSVVAEQLGLSARTLERRFLAETGMTFGQWRRHARLLAALRALAAGDPVKTVASAAGYRSVSAFVAAFHATFGVTPGQYFQAATVP